MAKNRIITVQDIPITVANADIEEYICITDMAAAKGGISGRLMLLEKTNAKDLYVKKGRYGGTFAHKDIAFEFASAISPVFKLDLIKEFQRLKENENDQKKLEWDAKRFLSKSNYRGACST